MSLRLPLCVSVSEYSTGNGAEGMLNEGMYPAVEIIDKTGPASGILKVRQWAGGEGGRKIERETER